MLRQIISGAKAQVTEFIGKVRVGGNTVLSTLRQNRKNTANTLLSEFSAAVRGGVDVGAYSQSLEKTIKRRKRMVLNTLRNINTAVRGQGRAILAAGKSGHWANVSTLDSDTTEICRSHVGRTWDVPYSQIENKPPRIPPIHPCRSFLVFREDGVPFEPEASFIQQFNDSEELRRELLGPVRFDALERGELQINTFAQFENAVLNTLDDILPSRAAPQPSPAQAQFFKDSAPVKLSPRKPDSDAVVNLPIKPENIEAPVRQPRTLNSQEIGELEYYKGDGFYENNKILLTPDQYDAERVSNARKTSERLNNIIDVEQTTKDHTFLRGIISKELFDNAENLIGKTLENRTLQSVTYSDQVADLYAGLIRLGDGNALSADRGASILFRINVKKGTSALNPARFTSINSGEKEIILKAGSRYHVKNVIDNGSHKIIEVDYEDTSPIQ